MDRAASKRLWKKQHKASVNATNRRWREKNPAKIERATRASNLVRRFGLTLAEYEAKLAGQNGACAICGRTTDVRGRRFAVDHDHQTGKIRGLLCFRCNNGLGCYDDNELLLLRALKYLREHRDGE
jgi:hypothetical protein